MFRIRALQSRTIWVQHISFRLQKILFNFGVRKSLDFFFLSQSAASEVGITHLCPLFTQMFIVLSKGVLHLFEDSLSVEASLIPIEIFPVKAKFISGNKFTGDFICTRPKVFDGFCQGGLCIRRYMEYPCGDRRSVFVDHARPCSHYPTTNSLKP